MTREMSLTRPLGAVDIISVPHSIALAVRVGSLHPRVIFTEPKQCRNGGLTPRP